MAEKIKFPPFTFPASAWAARISIILESAEIDISDTDNKKKIAPLIFSRLPNHLLTAASRKGSIREILDFLAIYDTDKPSVTNILTMPFTENDRPSLFYGSLVDKLTAALPSGTPDDAVKIMAWNRLCDALPEKIKPALIMLEKDKPPNQQVLTNLDDATAHSSVNNAAVAASVPPGNVIISELSDKLNSLSGCIKELELKVTSLQGGASNSKPRQSQIECYACGGKGHMARECRASSGLQGQRETEDKRKCFLCNKAGHFARNCRKIGDKPDQTAVTLWSRTTENQGWCDNHKRYGERTRVCHKPCNYQGLN